MKVLLCILAVLCPMAASAQTVFFDDFEGNALQPHWSVPPPSHWEYNVSDSRLAVTALLNPSIPHIPGNSVIFGARYEPQTDFRIDVKMGWEQGEQPHRLAFHVVSDTGHGIASFGYRNEAWSGEVLFVGTGTQGASFPAPSPGTYNFTITRVAAEFQFFLDGNLMATIGDLSARPASILSLEFLGPFPGQFGALHIDRIQIVPAPGSILVPTVMLFSCVRSQRHTPAARLQDPLDFGIASTRSRP